MAIPEYQFNKSRAEFHRASQVIPAGIYGHQGPVLGCYFPQEAYPFFSSRAEGSRFWDIDGNEYIDYMCGYGPNILGYNDAEIHAAAAKQQAFEDVVTIPSTIMIDFAELLVDTVASADWAFFAKNGGDTTTLAIMTARAATGRKKILFIKGYYHGVAQWTQQATSPGVLEEDIANNLIIPFNDLTALEEILATYKGEIAGLIAQPYVHGNFADNELPADGYWKSVQKLCNEHGVVLIVDDVRAGFRLDLAGSDHYFGFEADLICFCKALANGYNVSALCGKEALKDTVSSILYTGSYWLSAVPFAAGIATIKKLADINAPALFQALGTSLTSGLVATAKNHGFNLVASGAPALFYLRITDGDYFTLHMEWIAECVKRGVFLTSHHNHFINAALTQEDINRTVEIADEAFQVLRKRHPEAGLK